MIEAVLSHDLQCILTFSGMGMEKKVQEFVNVGDKVPGFKAVYFDVFKS
jgi:hypothetical protein